MVAGAVLALAKLVELLGSADGLLILIGLLIVAFASYRGINGRVKRIRTVWELFLRPS